MRITNRLAVPALAGLFVAGMVLAGPSAPGTGSARAEQAPMAGIYVEAAWARATPGNARSAVAYLTVINSGKAADRLTAVSSPIAAEAGLHTMSMENGIMRMRPAGPLAIPPGASLTLKPGGEHIMLTGLKAPLKEGASFPLTLTFAVAGTVEVQVQVEKAGAMGPMNGGHAGMKM